MAAPLGPALDEGRLGGINERFVRPMKRRPSRWRLHVQVRIPALSPDAHLTSDLGWIHLLRLPLVDLLVAFYPLVMESHACFLLAFRESWSSVAGSEWASLLLRKGFCRLLSPRIERCLLGEEDAFPGFRKGG